MRLLLIIPAALATVALALPQGGSMNVPGYCLAATSDCLYSSEYDCLNRGQHSYDFCVNHCRCENKFKPPPKATNPSTTNRKPGQKPKPSTDLPFEKSNGKEDDEDQNPNSNGGETSNNDDLSFIPEDESEGETTASSPDGEETAFAPEGEEEESPENAK